MTITLGLRASPATASAGDNRHGQSRNDDKQMVEFHRCSSNHHEGQCVSRTLFWCCRRQPGSELEVGKVRDSGTRDRKRIAASLELKSAEESGKPLAGDHNRTEPKPGQVPGTIHGSSLSCAASSCCCQSPSRWPWPRRLGPKSRNRAADGRQAFANLAWKAATPTPVSARRVADGRRRWQALFVRRIHRRPGASSQVDVYDPASDTWTRRKDMPTGVTHLNPAIDGNTIWLAGGFKGRHPGPVTDEVWKYDIAADSWTAGPPLPEPRAGGGLAIAGRKLHYFGGYKSDRDTDAADHWTLSLDGRRRPGSAKPICPTRAATSRAAVLDGKIYALGGDHGHDVTQIDQPSCDVFDPDEPAVARDRQPARWPQSFRIEHDHLSRRHLDRGRAIEQPRAGARRAWRLAVVRSAAPIAWQVVGTMPEKVLAPSAAIIGNRIVVTGGGLNNPRPLTAKTWIATIGGHSRQGDRPDLAAGSVRMARRG